MRKLALAVLGLVLPGCAQLGELSEYVASNTLDRPPEVTCAGGSVCPDLDHLWIADLHVDTLLWQRDIWEPLSRKTKSEPRRGGPVPGHVNTRRLREGGVNLQVFAIATHTPLPREIGEDPACASRYDIDTQVVLKIQELHRDPFMLWSRWRRARDQMRQFQDWLDDPRSGLTVVETSEDLAKPGTLGTIGAILAVEGMHWVYGTPEEISAKIATLARRGVRMAGLTHRFSNALASSSEDCDAPDRGLTEAGTIAIAEMARQGIILDLAHASPRTITQATEILRGLEKQREAGVLYVPSTGLRPVVSHGGIFDACRKSRNLTPANVRDVVLARGVIGVGYWPDALCWGEKKKEGSEEGNCEKVEASKEGDHLVDEVFKCFVRAQIAILMALSKKDFPARYYAEWEETLDPYAHLALGSDFDGAVPMRFDVSDVPALLGSLQRIECDALGKADDSIVEYCKNPGEGKDPILPFTSEQIAQMAGTNVYSLLLEALPVSSANHTAQPSD